MSGKKIAIVTGSNKGIGYAIVRGLCKDFDGDVFLTARDEGRGQAAIEDLKKEGHTAKFHQLDIDNVESINRLRDFVKENYGGLDILVNNAGIAFKAKATESFAEQAEITNRTNFFSTLNVCKILFPLLRSHARVVNVSSWIGGLTLQKCSEEAKARVLGVKTVADVEAFMNDFVRLAKEGKHKEQGWPESAYGMSKAGLTAVSLVQQKDFDADKSREDIVINAVSPGWVATDMSSHGGNKSIDQGAEAPLYLALLPPNVESPRGCYVTDEKIVEKWG